MTLAHVVQVKNTRNVADAKIRRGTDHRGPHPARLFFHQRRQLREYIGHPAPELFLVPLEPGDLLWVHAEGVGMDGHLIEIIGAPPL